MRYIDDISYISILCINEINSIHPTSKSTADWSNERVDFLDTEVTHENNLQFILYNLQSTINLQFLDATPCHPYYCNKSMSYSQALRLNRICFDKF